MRKPKRIKVYHGTGADNLPSILKHGFDGYKGTQLWSCSSGYNYFWNPADFMKQSWIEDENDAQQEAMRYAKESADVSLVNAKDCRRVIFEVEVSKHEISRDSSCENMEGAVMATSPVPPDRITKIWIDGESLDFFKPYFAATVGHNNLRLPVELSPIQQAMVKALKKSDDFLMLAGEAISDLQLVEFVR